MTVWTEERPEDAHYICINLASLERDSLNLLDALKILPTIDEDDHEFAETTPEQLGKTSSVAEGVSTEGHRLIRGEPWFEELIQSGPLGKIKRRRGGQFGRDGQSVIDWEIIEIDGSEGAEAPLKRQVIEPVLSNHEPDEMIDG